jgi:plastocyanin
MKMQKYLWPMCAIMGILLTGAFTFAVCAQIAQAATTAKDSAKVSIVNFVFAPAEITIAPGESVTWTNDDGAPHGLEYHDGAKGTDLLLPGASFSRQFDRPGTYDYNCSVHPYMTGRVIVRAQ